MEKKNSVEYHCNIHDVDHLGRNTCPLCNQPLTDQPLAVKGLTSYRYRGTFSWIMIGAKNDADALREANRSLTLSKDNPATIDKLEIWGGDKYVPAGGK